MRRRFENGRALLGATLAALAAAVAVAGCGDDGATTTSAPAAGGGEGRVGHVHGLGVDPADGALLVATHTGLFRSEPGSGDAERVGDVWQDTMGFTVVGPRRYLGSGHPDVASGLPPLLGLIESGDGGRSWTPVSLLGEADFHVLEAAGRRVYGYDATGARLLASSDRGRTWTRRPSPEPLLDLAIDPRDPEHLLASTDQRLHESRDGGRTWEPLGTGQPGHIAWAREAITVVDPLGGAWRSEDGGGMWVETRGPGGRPVALGMGGGALYVALEDHAVMASEDGGRSWVRRLTLR